MTRPMLVRGDVVGGGSGGPDPSTTREHARSVVWTRWVAVGDERSCPACTALAGGVWPVDAGPQPPLHRHCRCQRVFAFAVAGSRAE